MEIPADKNTVWPDAQNLYLLGCLEPVRITLVAQQTRALNLIYALACENKLRRGTKVAIIGGGPAGLTAAKAAYFLGANVRVFERKEPMAVFAPTKSDGPHPYRVVHPGIENWPRRGWDIEDSHIPFLSWAAGNPKNVRDEIAEKFFRGYPGLSNNNSRDAVDLRLYVHSAAHIERNKGKWLVHHTGRYCSSFSGGTWNSSSIKDETFDARVLILSIGFGIDEQQAKQNPVRNTTPPYWEFDKDHWDKVQKAPKVLVSGSGDGALIDAINFALWKDQPHKIEVETENGELKEIEVCPHELVIHLLRKFEATTSIDIDKKDGFLSSLLELESKIDSGMGSTKIWNGYQDLSEDHAEAVLGFDKLIEPFLPTKAANVSLVTRSNLRPLSKKAFAINRFVCWRLVEKGRIRHLIGDIVESGAEIRVQDQRERAVRQSHIEKEDFSDAIVVRRYGPSTALKYHFPKLDDICKEHLVPKNELDQTRFPCWPKNFFVDEPKTKLEATVTTVIAERRFEAIFVKATFSRDSKKRNSNWVNVKCDIEYGWKDVGQKPIRMEIHVPDTEPFNFRFLSSVPNGGALPLASSTRSVTYDVYCPKDASSKKNVRVSFEGKPSCGIHMPDAAGFPIYGDMIVERIEIELTFDGLQPIVFSDSGTPKTTRIEGVARFQTPIRRLAYEDGETSNPWGGANCSLASQPTHADNKLIFKEVWQSAPEEGTHELKRGLFYGLQWDQLEIVPVASPVKGSVK